MRGTSFFFSLICYKTYTLITTAQLNIFKTDYHRLHVFKIISNIADVAEVL